MNAHPAARSELAEAQYRRGRRTFIALAIGFCLLFAAAVMLQLVLIYNRAAAMRGDGTDPATYGFELANLTVDPASLTGGNLRVDQVLTLDDPLRVTKSNMKQMYEPGPRVATLEVVDEVMLSAGGAFRRIIIDSDSVIGVVVNGEARAYPIRFMRWHEVCNDTLGGVPIAVTYSPLCDSVAAFDRRVGGETITFGHAGLLCNSNLVMYDRRDPIEAQSLWSQLGLGPIAGPAVTRGESLTLLPVWYGDWKAWRAAHPQTTLLLGDTRFKKRYKDSPLDRSGYFAKKEFRYPVRPLLPADPAIDAWTPIIAIPGSGEVLADTSEASIGSTEPRVYALYWAWHAFARLGAP